VLLTLLALAVPPAFAISDDALNTVPTGPAAIEVSTTLDSCGILDNGVVCKLDVSFNSVENAATYSATVTRADGSVIDYGAVGPGGTSLWVPYVGSGNYSVRITAYGEPETPDDADGRGDVIAVGSSNPGRNRGEARQKDHGDKGEAEQAVETGVTGRGPDDAGNSDASGAPTTDVGAAPTAPTTECTAPTEPVEPLTPPEEPPADTDPDNPDEDADGIPDEQEQAVFEQQMAEYEAAVAAQQPTDAPAC
jgi:hypothetical protein